MADRVCCWTNCNQPQGGGTWTEINGETLPVCEDHWYGNWTRIERGLTAEVTELKRRLSRVTALLRHGIEVAETGHSDEPEVRRG